MQIQEFLLTFFDIVRKGFFQHSHSFVREICMNLYEKNLAYFNWFLWVQFNADKGHCWGPGVGMCSTLFFLIYIIYNFFLYREKTGHWGLNKQTIASECHSWFFIWSIILKIAIKRSLQNFPTQNKTCRTPNNTWFHFTGENYQDDCLWTSDDWLILNSKNK